MSDISDDDSKIDTELQEKFNAAADYIQKIHSKLSSGLLLKLYGLYKQATCGLCNTPKPTGLFNLHDKSKWGAWNSLGNMEMSEAMELYIEKVVEAGWDIEEFNSQKTKTQQQWVCHSVHLPVNEIELDDNEKTVFDFVKEINLEKLKLNLIKEQIDKRDSTGLGLIHWATDRNAAEVLEYLLQTGADINLKDDENQTALHYASSCGHCECVKILLKYGADKNIKDIDDQNCLEVAFDETISMLLKTQ